MRGILFKPELIKAIAEGRKTQTRRLHGLKEINQEPDKWKYHPEMSIPAQGQFTFCYDNQERYNRQTATLTIKSRYQVGEVVFVKEALSRKRSDVFMPASYITYALDFTPVSAINPNEKHPEFGRPTWIWQKDKLSPLFMPEWAARYHIQLTGVDAQRVQEITHGDAIAEGAEYMPPASPRDQRLSVPQIVFAGLWDSINKNHKWDTNPWVWRYSFKKENQDGRN